MTQVPQKVPKKVCEERGYDDHGGYGGGHDYDYHSGGGGYEDYHDYGGGGGGGYGFDDHGFGDFGGFGKAFEFGGGDFFKKRREGEA